jgi:hypothetical protein
MVACGDTSVRGASRTGRSTSRRYARRLRPIRRPLAAPAHRPRPASCAASTERVVRRGVEAARALVALGAVAAWCAVLLMLAG